ncbi:MAG: carboxypeptidase regulatory-like domain-containing protein [Candidatus Electryonea clarkiae]|nr:carboxypeptidase regulatory-like domain-containing protein [Candidatus Electryonea clarkiae]MDP8286508.1 carboxypeptidase regulatory-like domain-containing protein [Candidatus Electryonea clarkiae]
MLRKTLILASCLLILVSSGFAFDYEALMEAKRIEGTGVQLTDAQKTLIEEDAVRNTIPYNELDRTGGPDDLGMMFIDSNEEGGPEYEWIDITDTGTLMTGIGDDTVTGPYDFGFDFPFYGVLEDDFWFQSNGMVTFFSTYCTYGNGNLPHTAWGATIFWFWDDMHPRDGAVYYDTIEIDEREALVISMTDYAQFGANGTFDCEIIMFDDGDIILMYDNITDDFRNNSQTIGIQNHDHDVALAYLVNGDPDAPENELAVLFYAADADASVAGVVTDSETGDPVEGAIVTFGIYEETTDGDGVYSVDEVYSGIYTFSIEMEGYFEFEEEGVEIETGENEFNFEIDILSGDLTGNVIDENTEEVLVGVDIVVIDELGETVRELQTDDLGNYITLALHSGETFGVVASLAGYAPSDTENVTISHSRENVRDFELTPIFERTIEQLQTTQDPETWVLTTGIVIQGTNVTDTAHTNIYIQDDSDWGIQIWADAPWAEDTEIMRGDSVEVVGYLLDVDDITRITNFEIEVFSHDNALPEPLVEPTGDMSTNGQREGTWGQVSGQINRDPGDDTYTLIVDDGSGQCNVQIVGTANLDLSAFSMDDWGTFTGIISLSRQGLRIIPNDQADIERINIDAPSDLTSAQEVIPGDPLQLEVTLSWAHDHLDDWIRFKIYRDGEHLGNTQQNTWNEKIEDPDPGEYASYTYVYTVTAVYDEGETPESNEVEVIWDITSVSDSEFSGVPIDWALEAVYPNPFNPTVSIVIAVPQIAEVQAEIINVLGQRVAVLQQGSLTPGYHRLNWNATNHPAGLYFLRVSSNSGFSNIRKLMYIK